MSYKWIWNSNKQRKWSAEWTKSVLVCPGLFHRWLSPDLDSHVAELWLVNTSIFFSQKLFPVWSSVWRVGNDRNQPSGALKIRVFSDEMRDECHREIKHFSVCVNEKKKSQEFHTKKKKISRKKNCFHSVSHSWYGKKIVMEQNVALSFTDATHPICVTGTKKNSRNSLFFSEIVFFHVWTNKFLFIFFKSRQKLNRIFFFSGEAFFL